MGESETERTPKPRPIIRIGLFLIAYSLAVSVICSVAGIVALLLLPVLAKNTYTSENALMPGSASPMLSNDDALEGQKFMNRILSLESVYGSSDIEISQMIAEHIIQMGGEANYHKFQPISTTFNPLHFFLAPDSGTINENKSCFSFGINTVGIIRAPHGDGKEAIVIITPYNSSKVSMGEALSLGIAYSVISLISRVTWLSKDIIWVAADTRHGEYAAVATWLKDYNTLSFGDFDFSSGSCVSSDFPAHEATRVKENQTITGFRRAGTIAAGIVVKVADKSAEYDNDALKIYAEASNGQMPNLDLINIVNYLAVHGQGFQVRVEKIWTFLDSWLLNSLGELFEIIGKVAKTLNPQWKFGIPSRDYVEGSATLASSLYNQALGVPTGSHGPFRNYQVDALTMEISPNFSPSQRVLYLTRVGRLVEGVIRSVNNLLEKFHQSFFLYLLTSPSRFVSVGVYMIAFGLLVAPLPLVSASLYCDASKSLLSSGGTPSSNSVECLPTFKSWTWLCAAKTVLFIHLWSIVVALLPYFISQIPNISPSIKLLQWIVMSGLILFFIRGSTRSSTPEKRDWVLLKSATISATFAGLCVMSVLNFAIAELGALLMVPLCLTAAPLRLDLKPGTKRLPLRGACNVLLAVAMFPPSGFLMIKGAFLGFNSVRLGDFWDWTESLWVWNSATYIFISMVHLPCWALCTSILTYSC